MVAVIKSGHSIHRIFNYNENKVKEGVAECIGEGNYPVDVDRMSLNMKLNRFLKQLELNKNVTRNSVHISLNFHPNEMGLGKNKLMAIADAYMKKIGFSVQPFLVYLHHDAGHPHIHIISIKVRSDGSRIDMHNIGKNQSEKARKEIEKEYGLVVAEGRKNKQDFELEPIVMGKIRYGKLQSKKALTYILEGVLNTYKYTSIPELNAVLLQYNVLADRGSENSRIYKAKGLVYRILDEQGKPIGVPIKASDFYNNPTLKFLEDKFQQNEAKRMPYKARIKNAIDKTFIGKAPSLDELIKALEKQGIHVALRKNNEAGLIYGITYVDHQTKCIFNGSALGKQYSAKAIQERCGQTSVPGQDFRVQPALKPIGLQPQPTALEAETKASINEQQHSVSMPGVGKALDGLMQPEQTPEYLPYHLKKNRKKKKRKQLSNNP